MFIWKQLTAITIMLIIPGITFAQTTNTNNLPYENSPFLTQLINQAKEQAKLDYIPAPIVANEVLKNLSYQQYKSIRFKPEESIWRGLYPYEVQLFHTGFLYKHPININVIDYRNKVSNLAFDTDYFRYERLAEFIPTEIKTDVGFAGFRIHYPVNGKEYKDELAAFLGATYFRLIGQQQKYGMSARGLAIDTAMPEGEEFPYFTDFWLIEPANGKKITVYAKMDSPSITGIYKFTIESANNTEVDIKSWLFARKDIDKLGIAPFTSMFLYGENSLKKPDDYRPEVHDSDGMMLVTSNDEQLWRPLDNPNRLRITSLGDNNMPKGFGMLQRDIQYEHYVDSEAHYHQRPGLWVTPYAGFEKGRLELVEIPTNSETNDNIVAYWVNDQPVEEGDSLYLHYQLRTVSADAHQYQKASVLRTLQGADKLPGEQIDEESLTRRFIVDFSMPNSLRKSVFKEGELMADISATNGRVEQVQVFPANSNHELRATFLFSPNEQDSVSDIRLVLKHKSKAISEIWTYVYE